MTRRFIDAPTEQRCQWTVKLRDGSEAQCGRHKADGDLCTQHAKMAAKWSCEYCGGNDELPPDHCMDCTRPKDGVDVPRAADPLEGAPEVCEGCGAIEARNESHHHACPRGVEGRKP